MAACQRPSPVIVCIDVALGTKCVLSRKSGRKNRRPCMYRIKSSVELPKSWCSQLSFLRMS